MIKICVLQFEMDEFFCYGTSKLKLTKNLKHKQY